MIFATSVLLSGTAMAHDKVIRLDVLEKISDLAPTMMRFPGESITILTLK